MRTYQLLLLIILFLGIIAWILNGQKSEAPQPNPTPASTITINSAQFNILLARTSAEHEQGLSNRPDLPVDTGMLFVFTEPANHSFWMKDMKFPLDIIFIHENKVVGVYENLPPLTGNEKNPAIYGSSLLSDMVFEINAGLAKKNNIKVGDMVIVDFK